MRRCGLRLRSCGKSFGSVVVAIVMLINGLHMVLSSGDMARCRQMVVFAGRMGISFGHDEAPW